MAHHRQPSAPVQVSGMMWRPKQQASGPPKTWQFHTGKVWLAAWGLTGLPCWTKEVLLMAHGCPVVLEAVIKRPHNRSQQQLAVGSLLVVAGCCN